MKIKICYKCKKEKLLSEFYKDRTRSDNHMSKCKSCDLERNRVNYNSIYQPQYYKKYKTYIIKRNSHYNLKRRQNNIEIRLFDNFRRRINIALKNNVKSRRTQKLLGCSIEQLKQYLESKFKPGMTWKNHNIHGWHIDHIRPCASFDLSKPKNQMECFHYSNLQPLWAKENLRKGKLWKRN